MTHRLASRPISVVVLGLLVMVLVVLAVGGCSTDPAPTSTPYPPRPVSLAGSATSRSPARTDPAVWAAVRFEQSRCNWDWRRPLHTYLAAQQARATVDYARHLAAESDPVSWQHEVVAAHQQVSCTVSAPARLVGAPSTANRVYVRMSVHEHVTSTVGSFDGGDAIASCLVEFVDGRWLVAGTFGGG